MRWPYQDFDLAFVSILTSAKNKSYFFHSSMVFLCDLDVCVASWRVWWPGSIFSGNKHRPHDIGAAVIVVGECALT